MTAPTFIVLDDGVTAIAVRELAARHRWAPRGDTPRGHDVLASRRWLAGGDTDVLYGEDHTSGCRWVRIEGPRALEVGGAVRGALPSVRPADVLARIAQGDARTCIRAAGQLAALRPSRFDADHFEALQHLLTHEVIGVRRAGIRCAFGCRWPQLAALVRDLLQRKQRPQPGLGALLAWIESPEANDPALEG